jgi:CRP/FNR family transcriptional regulator, cyclic AMP receptor protein
MNEKMLLIRNYDLWSQLSNEEYEELNLVHHFKEAKKGEFIYFESHLLNKLFFIKEGFIRIGYINEQGEEVVKEIIRKGEVFGQFTLQRDNLQGEFAQAHKSDVSLCAFNIDDFERILQRKPQLAIHFSKQVGQKLRATENRLINLLHKDVRRRFLGFVLHLATRAEENVQDNQIRIENIFTHDDIARLIASTRQTVTTLISQCEAEGFLHWDRHAILVRDVKRIQKELNVA